MVNKKVFHKYYSKLVLEGMIKALIFGFIVGVSLSIIPAFVTLLVNYNGLWISIGVGLGAALVATPLFYYVMFRPTTKQIGRRIDRLGYDERIITMIELEKDESYIAMLQREDAKTKLNSGYGAKYKISVFVAPIVVVALLCVSAVSMITVSALSVDNPINWKHPGAWEHNKDAYFSVSYIVDEEQGYAGGYIEGDANQLVIAERDTAAVTAIADFGYVFYAWSDGKKTETRTDTKIIEDCVYSAIFRKQELPEGGGDAASADSIPGDEEDDEDGEKQESRYAAPNQILDNQTYYRDRWQEFYDEVMEILNQGDISPELRDMIEKYVAALK